MSITTYRIIGATLAIPGVSGLFHAGQEVDVDTDTNTVLATRLMPSTAPNSDQLSPVVDESTALPFDETLPSPTVAVEQATAEIDERNVE